VQLLLDAGAEVDRASTKHDWVEISYSQGNVPKTRDLGGLTALQFAARSGSSDAVEVLLAAGADPAKVEPMYELTALELAIVNGHYALAKRLIERGVSVDDGSLYLLLDTRNLGFYAQRPNPPEKDGGVTSLDVLALLLEHGAKPDLPYTKGIPERTVAGQIEVPAGATPLDRAAAALDYAAIDVLLAHGASPNVATDDGTTPLMQLTGYSRKRGGAPVTNAPERLAAIRALLTAGADVDAAQEESGNTALHFAAMRGVPEIVELLEAFGASEELKNEAGKTPRDLLARSAAQKN
jgi:ankyrin repeat protein